ARIGGRRHTGSPTRRDGTDGGGVGGPSTDGPSRRGPSRRSGLRGSSLRAGAARIVGGNPPGSIRSEFLLPWVGGVQRPPGPRGSNSAPAGGLKPRRVACRTRTPSFSGQRGGAGSLSAEESQVMTRGGSIRAVEADTDRARAVDGNSEPRRVLAGRVHAVRGRTRRGRYRETRLRIRRFDVRGPVEIERFDEPGHVLRRLGEGHDACREERVSVEDRDLPQGVGAVEG